MERLSRLLPPTLGRLSRQIDPDQEAALQRSALRLLRKSLDDRRAEFRDGQWEAIRALVLDRKRLLLVQRTGWGKSSVYFIATALLREQGRGPTLLISPLLSLMRNQIELAERIGVRAVSINSSNTHEWSAVEAQLLTGEVDILLISPERLANEKFRENVLSRIAPSVGLLVIDEAHCISDWGHDFRPDYQRIVRVLGYLPRNVPVLCTTATANDRVIEDIVAQIGSNLEVQRGPLIRESLQLQNLQNVRPAWRLAWLAEQVPQLPGSGIIYTLTINDCNLVTEWLKRNGIDAEAYSARLEDTTREDLEGRLLRNELKVLVATVALGMGFDKPDLGFVIHYQRPGSVVHYYQQIGRAGRALDNAHAVLMHGNEDILITDHFIRTAFPREDDVDEILTALREAKNGLTFRQIERQANVRASLISKTLKLLELERRAPVRFEQGRWYATIHDYKPDRDRIERLERIRRHEMQRMDDYFRSRTCLMQFLLEELNDPRAAPCGRCASCLGEPPLPVEVSAAREQAALEFLERMHLPIEPRKKWPQGLEIDGWSGTIDPGLRAQPGQILCRWGDPGWGELVQAGKSVDGRFNDQLVQAMSDMIQLRWRPRPEPRWITCVPSRRHPELVHDFTRRLARAMKLPFVPCIEIVRDTLPQKEMQNSHRQAANLDGAFSVRSRFVSDEPVLLVDDMVDSRWTMTVLAALLREAGSGPVYPAALASTTNMG